MSKVTARSAWMHSMRSKVMERSTTTTKKLCKIWRMQRNDPLYSVLYCAQDIHDRNERRPENEWVSQIAHIVFVWRKRPICGPRTRQTFCSRKSTDGVCHIFAVFRFCCRLMNSKYSFEINAFQFYTISLKHSFNQTKALITFPARNQICSFLWCGV